MDLVTVVMPSGGKKVGTIVEQGNEPDTHRMVQFDDRPEPMRVHVSHIR